MKEKLIEIIQHYGTLNQLKYLHTEYFELDQAIINYEQVHHIFEDIEGKNHIAEELADITVMLKQIQYFYRIEDKDVEDIMLEKVQRQLDRIKKEQEGK